MSSYPTSHLFCSNNIYKIVLSMEDNSELPHIGTENEFKYF